jgi:hypothetical protein
MVALMPVKGKGQRKARERQVRTKEARVNILNISMLDYPNLQLTLQE